MENVSSFALLEYSFPLNLFFDIANSFVISLLVFCICKVYKINHNLTFVLFLSCFTPFYSMVLYSIGLFFLINQNI